MPASVPANTVLIRLFSSSTRAIPSTFARSDKDEVTYFANDHGVGTSVKNIFKADFGIVEEYSILGDDPKSVAELTILDLR